MMTVLENAAINEKPAARLNPVDSLLKLVSSAEYHRGSDGRLYARVHVSGQHDFFELRSAAFRDWLVGGYFLEHGAPPATSAISRVVAVLEARARFQGTLRPVFVRVAVGPEDRGLSPAYYLDLGDPSGRAVEIRDSGWSVVDRPGIEFRRPPGMMALPVPRAGGSNELLKPYVNLGERSFRLFVAWLTAALRPVGPYPPLVLEGEQGTAKSTLARVARLLIDPHSAPLLGDPSSTRDLMATAVNVWLVSLDNISVIPPWLSDALCRLAVGGGHASRALFTDDQVNFMYTQRPIILNGINSIVTRGDLVDRSLFLHARPIRQSNRLTEAAFWKSFQADYPAILGGLLDAVAKGLGVLPSVSLKRVPRMADFAHWGEAVGRGLGWPENAFIKSYLGNQKAAGFLTIEDSMVATVLMGADFIYEEYTASLAKFYVELTNSLGPKISRMAEWPKCPAHLGRELRRVAPQLRTQGLWLTFTRNSQYRRVTIKRRSS
jgi:hypothetical protein